MTPIENLLKETNSKMSKTIEFIHHEFSTVRTGKASPSLVENINVDYYGTPTRIKELAGISTPEPRMIVIQPWDPTTLGAIDKAIRSSDLDLNPQNDGKLIRVPIPPLTEERRKALVKHAHRAAEDGRIAVRNVRRDANDRQGLTRTMRLLFAIPRAAAKPTRRAIACFDSSNHAVSGARWLSRTVSRSCWLQGLALPRPRSQQDRHRPPKAA